MSVSSDVIILPVAPDRWVAYNLFARTALGFDSQGLALLGGEADAATECRIWKVGWFANEEGTLADPTRFRRDSTKWGEGEVLDAAAALQMFRESFLIIEDEDAYRERFARKASSLDGSHFGNFHDQLGAYLLFNRLPASDWWLGQKFSPDRAEVRRDNLYGTVQWPALKAYFERKVRPGMRVADLGCGTGIYSGLMASRGADVLGLDPNEDYLEIGRRNFTHGKVEFRKADVGQPGALDDIPTGSMDMVFMSDALLFYFVKVSRKDTHRLEVLLADIRRILSDKGRFVSVEPHPVFYLAPWLGGEDRPFTAVTEYRNRTFSSTPNFAQTIQAFSQGGFQVNWMEEFYHEPSEGFEDGRAAGFATEFPLWTLLEMTKTGTATD